MEFRGVGHASKVYSYSHVHVPVLRLNNDTLVILMMVILDRLVLHIGLHFNVFLFVVRDSTFGSLAQLVNLGMHCLLNEETYWHTVVFSYLVLVVKVK